MLKTRDQKLRIQTSVTIFPKSITIYTKGQQTFSVKRNAKYLGFVSHMESVATVQPSCGIMKTAVDNIWTNGHDLFQ